MPKILFLLLLITVSAWAGLFYQHAQMTQPPMLRTWILPGSEAQWQPGDFTVVYIMWSVMMAAMMLPSVMPMVNAYRRACLRRYHSDSPYSGLFSFSYLLIWLVFSIILTLMQWQFHRLQWLSGMMENTSGLLAATIFVIAGVYQFTQLKNACLHHCRSPVSFLMNNWHEGRLGAFFMGLKHGVTCLGCCWAQMLLMFALGVMNISAMIAITLFILLEKGLPDHNTFISKGAGILLCLWGFSILILEGPIL